MTRKVVFSFAAAAAMCCASGLGFAQESVVDELYGRGVHAYFSHNDTKAYEFLSDAIKNGSRDPRAFYFRGLALNHLGRIDEGTADIQEGAKLEAANPEATSLISKSLERVQGSVRLEIEASRKSAKLTARNEKRGREERRYREMEKAEAQVLRRKPNVAQAAFAADADKAAAAADPFVDAGGAKPVAVPAKPAAAPEAIAKPAAEADPFGEPAAKPAEPMKPAAEADPFGEPAAKPAEPMKPAAEADPFGEPAAKPVEPMKPATEADPFGEPAAKPAEPEKAMPKEEASADPFGDDAPAAKPAPKTEEGAAAPTDAAKGKGAGSLFRAFGKAILQSDEAPAATPAGGAPAVDAPMPPAKPAEKPAAEESADPFADDPEPAAKAPAKAAEPMKPAAKPAEVSDPFAEDPFK